MKLSILNLTAMALLVKGAASTGLASLQLVGVGGSPASDCDDILASLFVDSMKSVCGGGSDMTATVHASYKDSFFLYFTGTASGCADNRGFALQDWHSDFDAEMLGSLTSSSCAAFQSVTTVRMAKMTDANALNHDLTVRGDVVEVAGPLTVELIGVDTDTLDDSCTSILQDAVLDQMIDSFGASSDMSLVLVDTLLTSSKVENSHGTLGTNLVSGRWVYYTGGGCRFCYPDPDFAVGTAHGSFESNLLSQVAASGCAAFQAVTGVQMMEIIVPVEGASESKSGILSLLG